MLILSEAALRYAVDVCMEKESSIIIVVRNSNDVRRVSKELEDIIFDTGGRPRKEEFSPRNVYYGYANYSTIRIITVWESMGYRVNTVIVQEEIFDTPIVNTIFRPIETLDQYEILRKRVANGKVQN